MNNTQTVGMNATQSIGAMKMTSVMGDANMFITGKLMEMIEGDVHSETMKERQEFSKGKTEVTAGENIHKNSKKEIVNNSGEKSNSH